MTQNNYLSQKKIDSLTPHIQTHLRDQFYGAIDDFRKTKKFLKASDSYILTDEYNDLLESFGDDPAAKIVDHIRNFVGLYYDKDKDPNFNWWLPQTIRGLDFILREYNLQGFNPYNEDSPYTIDNYEDLLEDNIDTFISNRIEDSQRRYAEKELNLNHYLSIEMWNKLEAILATAQCGSLEEIEQLVSNSFDFDELIIQQS